MKKVGIITFHNAHNYGAVLQVYALQEKITELGYETKVINYENKKITRQYSLIKYSRKNPIKSIKLIYESVKDYKINKERFDKFENFITKNLRLTKKYKTIKQLKANSPDFDCYITGSDQVWNANIVGELSDAYTLNFGKEEVNRISYAASIGIDKIDDKDKEQYAKKLEKIDKISVREESAARELRKILNKDVKVVLDPTLLIMQSDWDKRINCTENEEKYILAYMVEYNNECIDIINYLSEKTGLKVVSFNKEKIYKNEMKKAYTDDPFEFVNKIKNAEYVITTSFHATVFSIIYHKRFFVVPHKKTGNRVTNLLEKFNLKDRVFNLFSDFCNIDYEKKIDYSLVDKIIEKEREDAIRFLTESIEQK